MADTDYVVEAELVTKDHTGKEARRQFEYRARGATTPEAAVDELAHSFTADTDRRITPVNEES